MNNTRNYGIDLLRLVLMYMVCMLHTLGQGGVLNACEFGTLNHKVYWFLEILSYCAVDGFALISGFTAIDKPKKYDKLVEMWFQAFFYSFIITVILIITGINTNWTIKDLAKSALPVTARSFWYFTAYFALFFSIPILNKFIFSIDIENAKRSLILICFLFSIMSTVHDSFQVEYGYSAIWLMVLYIIGALAKKIKLFESQKAISLVLVWTICIFITWIFKVFLNIGRLTNFVSPTILLSGIIMVILFSRLKLNGNVIVVLSPLAFGIYLFQTNYFLWENFIYKSAEFIVSKNIIIGVVYAFLIAASIFVSGLAVDFIRSKLFILIKISALSKKIVVYFEICINKLLF